MSDNLVPLNVSAPATVRRAFPLEGTALANIIGTPAHRDSFHKKLHSINKYVVALYRIGLLPLFGAGKTTMLLTTRGRKSKQLRHFPVGYFRIAGQIHLLSGWGKQANWYKNMMAAPEAIWLQVGFRRFTVHAHVIEDHLEIRQTIETLVTESPEDAHRLFGWDPQHDCIEAADFSAMIEKVLFVRLTEC
jgi:deazaflavin-dependent oxidoreductase (nitroreductase family)